MEWLLMLQSLLLLFVSCCSASFAVPSSTTEIPLALDLQSQHSAATPASTLQSLAVSCDAFGIETFDVYGDYHLDDNASYLRRFESEVSNAFGKDDGVFMPSGVMAQSIALIIHARKGRSNAQQPGTVAGKNRHLRFACHHSSHLLLHEKDSYRELLGTDAVVISTEQRLLENGVSVPPMELSDVEATFVEERKQSGGRKLGEDGLATLIIELPHRELGGKLTPWEEVIQIGNLCRKEGIKYHCDGARIFEASTAYGLALPDIARPFESIYVSFYKGLGAISGAMLLGDKSFCDEARVWLRRFGGNLFTLLPYAVSAWAGYRKNVVDVDGSMTFLDKQNKMIRVVKRLSGDTSIQKVVLFDPECPETNMVHGYLRAPLEDCELARDEVERRTGIRVLSRIRQVSPTDPAGKLGFGARFEWAMGNANGSIDDESFLKGWKEFSLELAKRTMRDDLNVEEATV